MTRGRTGVALLGLVAAVALAVPQAQAAASGSAGEALRGVVRGVSHGQFAVYAWPSSDRLAVATEGDQMAMPLIQKGVLGSGGRFSVAIDAARLPQGVVSGNGQVDLQIIVTDGLREATWSTSVAQVGGRWSTTMAHVAKRSAPDEVVFDLAGETAELASDARDKQIDHGPATVGQARSAGAELATSDKNLSVLPVGRGHFRNSGIVYAPSETCVTTTGTTYYGLLEHFATVYGWSGATGTMDFDTGSSHTLGVGVSSSGTAMRQSGTASIGTSAGATIGNIADAHVKNRVNYRNYYNSCSPYEYRKPLSFNALMPSGDFTRAADHNYTASCANYYPGGTTWKQNVTNYTYSAGVDIGPINVSAQSGWNTATKLTYYVKEKSKICGSSLSGWVNSPGSSSRIW